MDQRVTAKRSDGTWGQGTLIGPGYVEGPSDIWLDGMSEPRRVEVGDWEYLPNSEQEDGPC